jgi:hypothetical protein
MKFDDVMKKKVRKYYKKRNRKEYEKCFEAHVSIKLLLNNDIFEIL